MDLKKDNTNAVDTLDYILRGRIRMLVEKLIFTGVLGRFKSGGDSCTMFAIWLVRPTFPRKQNHVHPVHPKRKADAYPVSFDLAVAK